jgi:hypothetical protein
MFTRKPFFLLRFFDGENPTGGTTPPLKPTLDGETFDFPVETKVADMTPEQRAEYWRHESKKQQKNLTPWLKFGSVDEVRTKLTAADDAAAAALSDADRALAQARTEAQTAGFEAARDKFAKPAVQAILVARTRGADETPEDAAARVNGVLEVIDVQKFIDADGNLDAAKVETFANTLAPRASNDGTPPGDLLGDVLSRQSKTPPGTGGSVAAMEQAFYDRLKPKSN